MAHVILTTPFGLSAAGYDLLRSTYMSHLKSLTPQKNIKVDVKCKKWVALGS